MPPLSDRPDAAVPAVLSGARAQRQPLLALLRPGSGREATWAAAPAVLHSAGELTYAELYARADAIAIGLLAQGARPGDRAAVLLPRDEWLIPSLLGLLSIGVAYVPLDASYPAVRLETTLTHAQVRLVLVTPELGAQLNPVHAQLNPADLAAQPSETAGADELATVTSALRSGASDSLVANLIYTSGTTGTPKGVSVSRAALANLLVAVQKIPGLDKSDRVLALSTIAFDIHALELLAPLVCGATIVLVDDNAMTQPPRLLQLIARHDVSLMQATPSMWGVLLGAGLPALPQTRGVAGGERLAPAIAEALSQRLERCWNMYGPTEATVYTTAHRLSPTTRLSIGRPLDNLSVAVVVDGAVGSVGQRGELAICGAGLADGYWQNSQATASQFVFLEINQQSVRAYLTGDLAFIDSEGNVHCDGRIDQQIKLRGHRIELSEIEHAMMAYSQLSEAACSVHRFAQDDERLVGYHTNPNLSDRELRSFLAQRLPPYMVPQWFVPVTELPRLASGKLDRSALPRPHYQIQTPAVQVERAEGKQSLEHRVLATSWQRLLGGPPPENTDNFMDQGGHSLLALRLVQDVQEQAGKTLPLRLIVLENFAALVDHLEQQIAPDSTPEAGILGGLKRFFMRLFLRT